MVDSIFSLPTLDVVTASYSMISLIIFTMAFEFSLHHVEIRLRTHTHYLKILSALYRELMILGTVSFLIVMIIQVVSLQDDTQETLEFVHVWFFFIALLFASHVVIYMGLSKRDKKTYDISRYRRIPDLIDEFKMVQLEMKSHGKIYNFFFAKREVFDQMEFHIIRSLFIRTYQMETSFDFAKYLRRCMSHTITEQLEVKQSSWIMLILYLVVDIIRVEVSNSVNGTSDSAQRQSDEIALYLFLAVPYALSLVCFWMYYVVNEAKRKLLHKMGCETTDQLESALIKSRGAIVKSSVNEPKKVEMQKRDGMRMGPRASILMGRGAMQTQQTGLDAYIPLLMNGLFPYNRPNIIIRLLETIMLSQCFFIGLAAIFHIKQAFDFFSGAAATAYVIFTMVPHIIILLLVAPRIISKYVFVHSVGTVDRHALSHTLEYMAETDELRHEIRSHLQQYADAYNMGVEELFQKMSNSKRRGNHVIDLSHLKDSLRTVDIHLDNSQSTRLMRMMNLGQNGEIDIREFSLFFFGSEGNNSLNLVKIEKGNQMKLDILQKNEVQRESLVGVGGGDRGENPTDGNTLENLNETKESITRRGPTIDTSEGPLLHSDDATVSDLSSPTSSFKTLTHYNIPSNPTISGTMLPSTHENPTSPPPASSPPPFLRSNSAAPGKLDLRSKHHSHGHHEDPMISATLTHSHPNVGHHPNSHSVSSNHGPSQSASTPGPLNLSLGTRHHVDPLDFAACFGVSNTQCGRCGAMVSVAKVGLHVGECNRAKKVETQQMMHRAKEASLSQMNQNIQNANVSKKKDGNPLNRFLHRAGSQPSLFTHNSDIGKTLSRTKDMKEYDGDIEMGNSSHHGISSSQVLLISSNDETKGQNINKTATTSSPSASSTPSLPPSSANPSTSLPLVSRRYSISYTAKLDLPKAKDGTSTDGGDVRNSNGESNDPIGNDTPSDDLQWKYNNTLKDDN